MYGYFDMQNQSLTPLIYATPLISACALNESKVLAYIGLMTI
jgi:hypothetical protein